MTPAFRRRLPGLYALGAAIAITAAAHAAGVTTVSQKGRAFHPNAIEIERGDTVQIVNDDEFVHHAYVKTDDFSFDSGEQELGASTEIVFSKSGEFDVRCGVHPKMRLHVTVK